MRSLSEKPTKIFSEDKRAMLAQLLQKEVAKSKTSPLSFAQQRLWHLISQNSTLYNMGMAFRLYGTLDIAILEKSCQAIIQRHEILRTTFTDGEQPLQTVQPPLPFKIKVLDSSKESNGQQIVATINNSLIKEIEQPFQLTQESLLRVTLLKLAETEQLLIIVTHHIVCDGWSLGIFCRELSEYYATFLTGNLTALAPLPIQYSDFVRWQHQHLQGERLQSHLAYWQSYLQGDLLALLLPTDRPQPLRQTYQGQHAYRSISPYLVEKCKLFCQQQNVTLFMMLLATFKILLYRYTGQEQIIVCVPFSGREKTETEGLIGYFNNILPIYSNLSHYPNFQTFLNHLRETVLAIYQHQELPYQKILEFPNLTHVPLNRALFALQNVPQQSFELRGMSIESMEIPKETADFELSLSIVPVAEHLQITLRYKTALFEPTTVAQILEHYQCLLERLIATPTQPLSFSTHCLDYQSSFNKARIELTEIEVVLCQHPEIQEAIVIVTEDKQLVAYFVPKMATQILSPNELKDFLQGKLPNYMLPSSFIKLDASPLLPNGRINRYHLPISEHNQLDYSPTIGDKLEFQLTKIWEKVLKISPIRPQDNFFELGGHSWLAVKLLYQIEAAFNVNLSLMTLFQSPTIRQFADVLREAGCHESWRLLEVIQPQGAHIPVFFFGPSQFAQALATWLGPEQPLYGLRVSDFEYLLSRGIASTVEEIAKRCLQEIQTVQAEGPYCIVSYHHHTLAALNVVRQLHLQQQEIALFALLDAFVDDLRHKSYSRLRHHWCNFRELGITYLFYKLQPFFKRLISVVYQSVLELKIRLGLQQHAVTAEEVSNRLSINTFYQMLGSENFLPRDRIIFLLSSEWRFQKSTDFPKWENLISDGLKIGEIKGYHHRLFVEPQVKILGNRLREFLEQIEIERRKN